MSDRGDEFRLMLKRELHYAWRPDVWRERGSLERASKHARSICEHLGLSWEAWWLPEPADGKWCARLRRDYPECAHMTDEGLRDHFGAIGDIATTWDHLGDAHEAAERMAKVLFTLLEAAGIER